MLQPITWKLKPQFLWFWKVKKASPSDTNCDGLKAIISLVRKNEKAMEADFAYCDWKEHRHLSTAMQQLLLEVQKKTDAAIFYNQ